MPVIDNAYKITEDNYAYSPSDLDSKHPNLSRQDMNALIDSLCKERMENPDVVILDKIQQRYPNDPIMQERMELEQDNIAVEEEILKGIFESSTPMTIEERNELVAKGLYDKYQTMKAKKLGKTPQQIAKEDNEAMADIEAELRANVNKPTQGEIESITEVISEEEVIEESFPEQQESLGTGEVAVEVEGTTLTEEDTGYGTVEVEPISEEDANKMACLDALGREEYKETTSNPIVDYLGLVEPSDEEVTEAKTKEIVSKALSFPSAVAGMVYPEKPYGDNNEIEELKEVIDSITSPDKLTSAIKEEIDRKNPSEEVQMSVEDINDVPATNISLPDTVITSALLDKYHNVDEKDAMQLVMVMKRYKDGEKFNVFEALPESLKIIIRKEAAAVNADKSTINFFAKSFINDLINDTFLDREIQDFNTQIQEVMAPMGNIAGTLMDEYTDDVYDKFTTQLLEKAEQIKSEDEEKAAQLTKIAANFEDSINMTRLINLVEGKSKLINYHYKNGRDNWAKMERDFYELTANVKPSPRDLKTCLNGLLSIGIREDIAKAIISIAKVTIEDALNAKSLEEHIYAYYLTNSFMTLSFTANTSETTAKIITSIGKLNDIIDEAMKPLLERNTTKQRKRNKRK
jgi:hypothetical protein